MPQHPARLANQDEPYTDPKVWWGTRPDTSGPVYKPMRWTESDFGAIVGSTETEAGFATCACPRVSTRAAVTAPAIAIARVDLWRVTLTPIPGDSTYYAVRFRASERSGLSRMACVRSSFARGLRLCLQRRRARST